MKPRKWKSKPPEPPVIPPALERELRCIAIETNLCDCPNCMKGYGDAVRLGRIKGLEEAQKIATGFANAAMGGDKNGYWRLVDAIRDAQGKIDD